MYSTYMHIYWVVPFPSNSHHQYFYHVDSQKKEDPGLNLHLPAITGKGDNPN